MDRGEMMAWALLLLVGSAGTEASAGPQMATAYRESPTFTAAVSQVGGGITITTAGGSATVGSRFSRPGPVWSTLTGAGKPGVEWTELRVVASAEGRWNVSAESPAMTLQRTVVVHPTHVAVADTLTARPGPGLGALPLAIQVEHTAQLTENATVTSAELPGALYPFSCTTRDNQDEYGTDGLSFGSFGNPAVFMQTADFGVGLLPLDDVFQIHSVGTQAALSVYPRGPEPGCPVTAPGSIEIADRNLGLLPGASYTQEWAIFPTSSGCTSYYCMINAARKERWAESSVRLNGTGYLSMGTNAPYTVYSELENSGYKQPWAAWDNSTWEHFLAHQSMHFLTSDIPYTERAEVCRPQQRLYCHGSCFVHELPNATRAGLQLLIERLRGLPNRADHPTLLYMDTWLSTETGAAQKYTDSRVLTKTGTQLTYGHCAQGTDYPLFFGTSSNSYGKQLDQYVTKALSLGFSGIYHDDFMLNNVGYTFGAGWDNFSVVQDPTTLATVRTAASLILLTQEHELSMLRTVRSHGGVMLYNGPPVTRTWSESVGSSNWAMHFAEDGQQCRVRFMHLSTPIALTRESGLVTDIDPKYNDTCKNSDVNRCLAQNIIANLDYGVLPFLYDGLFRNGSRPNVLEHMFPISVLRIEPRVVWGTDRIITSTSGSFGFAAIDEDSGDALANLQDATTSSIRVALYFEGLLVRNFTVAGAVANVSMASDSVDMAVLVHSGARA